MEPLLRNGGLQIRESDGKLERQTAGLGWDTPWHHVKHAYEKDCATWHQILFNMISSKLPEVNQFTPIGCQRCWKVVVRPKTLKQLFILEDLQFRLNHPSKCGIEVRPTVHGLYGGYFYNTGFRPGCECYKMVRKAVDEEEGLGKEINVFLKRGCTEMEHLCGDSRLWHPTEYQAAIEQLVDRYMTKDDVVRGQPDHLVYHIHRKWIEFAYTWGDPTYKEYTDGKPLHKPYVTFHHLADASDEEVQSYFDEANDKEKEPQTSG